MLQSCRDVNGHLGVAAEVYVLLVVVYVGGVALVHRASPAECLLTVAAVEELAVAEVEAYEKPALGVGHCPEAVGANVDLRHGLGIAALGKRTHGEPCVAQLRLLLPAACLNEEVLVPQIGIALLQVYRRHGIQHARQREVAAEIVPYAHDSTQVGRVGTGSQHMVAVCHQLVRRIVTRAHCHLALHAVVHMGLQRVLRPCREGEEQGGTCGYGLLTVHRRHIDMATVAVRSRTAPRP